MRILIIEDNLKLAEGLSKILTESSFVVDLVSNATDADAAIASQSFDLIILDLNLPDQDGLEVLRTMRGRGSDIPVLIVTARSDLYDRVKGLDLGADDYITKPFEVSELEARVRALIRRSAGQARSIIEFSNLKLDLKRNTLTAQSQNVDISPRELNVLRVMLMAKGRIVSKSRIVDSVCTFEGNMTDNALEKVISRLRKRLLPYGIKIQTARGLGYYLFSNQEFNNE